MPDIIIEQDTSDMLLSFRIDANDIARVKACFLKAYNMPTVLTEASYDEDNVLITPESIDPKYTDEVWVYMQIQKYVHDVVLQTEASISTKDALNVQNSQTLPLLK